MDMSPIDNQSHPGDPAALMRTKAGQCSRFGVVEGVQLFCEAVHPGAAFCMVTMRSGAANAACALEAHNDGNTVCLFAEVADYYGCAHRRGGRMTVATCCDCHLSAA